MATKIINISLPAELLKDVDQMARQEKRTRSEFFREAVLRYLREIADRRTFSELWDDWEEQHAQQAKAR